ncbi:MAG: hypothetical protein JW724_00755 [Candidatus Altiarchaeota archaeon]|nr:hypothetical protein [Candidatus Altiarchaeota archaeon]
MAKKKKKVYGLTALFCLMACASLAFGASTPSSGSESGSGKPTNMIVDFDLTSIDSGVQKGENIILNLVIKNTGDYRAEDVEVWIQTTSSIPLGKKTSVGRMEPGESKTLPMVLRVDANAKTGLISIPVQINFDGYDSDGNRDNDQYTKWEIPVTVYGDPLFQISLGKTTYYKDVTDTLSIEGRTGDVVKDLQVTLSSDCMTVIGSSRQYMGSIGDNQPFNMDYEIKPTREGACSAQLLLTYSDESGSKASDSIDLGLNVEEAGIDFKILKVEYTSTGPGETSTVKISIKNVGVADSEETTFILDLDEPFTPVETTEKYVGKVGAGETADLEYEVSVSWDSELKTYSIPLDIEYRVGGIIYSEEKNIGIDVSGSVILEVISIDASRGTPRIDVANIGTRDAEAVKATLVFTNTGSTRDNFSDMAQRRSLGNVSEEDRAAMQSQRMGAMNSSGIPANAVASSTYVSYKSSIKSNAQTTFTFDATETGNARLILEYTGPGNKRITQEESMTIGSSGSGTSAALSANSALSRIRGNSTNGQNTQNLLMYGGGALVVLVVGYAVYRKRKK